MLTGKDYIGGVPVVVRLHSGDILSATGPPGPAAFVLPRTTMLLAILRDVLALFSPLCVALQSNNTQVWFTLEGSMPVDWTCPVGAIKDYVTELRRTRRRTTAFYSATDSGRHAQGTTTMMGGGGSSHEDARVMLDTAALEPLELILRIHQPLKAAGIEKRVPFFVSYDSVDEYTRREVKQVLKASYTAMYGSFKLYYQVPADALVPADGMALYRPFESDAGTSSSGNSHNHNSSGGSGGRSASSSLATMFPSSAGLFMSPHLVSDYQHLLREVLSRRPAAYLVKLGFPLALAVHSGTSGDGCIRFTAHRVSAAPPVQLSPLPMTSSSTAPTEERDNGGATVVVTDGTEGEQSCKRHGDTQRMAGPESSPAVASASPTAVPDEREEAVTLGHLLWRLFRVPCLRWLAKYSSSSSTIADGASNRNESQDARNVYDQLLSFLAERYYVNAPSVATAQLETQEPLRTVPTARPPPRARTQIGAGGIGGGNPLRTTLPSARGVDGIEREGDYDEEPSPAPPLPWAAWEAAMVDRFIRDYDGEDIAHGEARGLMGFEEGSGGCSGTGGASARLVFEVQGTQPLLETPAKFLETYMSSSDRSLYVTIRLVP